MTTNETPAVTQDAVEATKARALFAKLFGVLPSDSPQDKRAVRDIIEYRIASVESATADLVKPWADFHGDLPDDDHPLRCVYEAGIQYAVRLLAKELKVSDYDACDGTEEFDGDLGGTLFNIVLAALPNDQHGDDIYPEQLHEIVAERDQLRAKLDEALAHYDAEPENWMLAVEAIEMLRAFLASLPTEAASNPYKLPGTLKETGENLKADTSVQKMHKSAWQPIETAPKDGTIIDVWLGDCSEDDRCFYCSGETRRSPSWAWHNGKFRPCGGLNIPTFVQPTHWMPLPSPPAQEGV